jgi:hypothetical protein
MPLVTIQWPAEQLDAFVAKAKGNLLAFASEFIQDVNNEVVINTPVVFGFLRGSWFGGINDEPTGTGSRDPSGGSSIARMNVVAATLTLGDIYTAVNTAVYAARVEYGFFGRDSLGRHYSQPGRGWVRAVIARVDAIAEAAAVRVRDRTL